ncbi:MAG: porin family protein [Dysgonamonadaceae bacterium]|jgi:hypothetical protein|nr:porin family protein [Dysgonamonadaceae bacterium]
MNKYFFSLIIFATVFTPVSAQVKFAFFKGIKANVALSDYNPTNTESNPGIGATLGSYDKLEIGEHFALQGEFLFRYAPSAIRDNSSSETNRFIYSGIEAHLYALGQFGGGSGKFFFGAGTFMGYGLETQMNMNRWNVGAGIIFGYQFAGGICINAAYQRGLPRLLNTGKEEVAMKSQVFSLGLGYRFRIFNFNLDKNKIRKAFFD